MPAPPRTQTQPGTERGQRRRAISLLLGALASPDPGRYGRMSQLELDDPEGGRLVSAPLRPGTGGRRPALAAGFQTDATRELRERLGAPLQLRQRGTTLEVWELDPGGD